MINIKVRVTKFMRKLTLFLLLLLSQQISAEEEQAYQLTNEDHRLVNMTSLNFHVCVQQDAQKQLAEQVDVRNIAAAAVSNCDARLEDLRAELAEKMPTRSYTGLERSIKNRAIKKLLMQLMYEKSAIAEESIEQ